MAKAALTAVSNEADEPRGDESLTHEAMAGWKPGQRKCRARRRHNWGPGTVFEHRTWLDVVEICSHCRNRRRAPFAITSRNRDGSIARIHQAEKWKPDYRDGYLLPKGAAPIDDDLKDELVTFDILSRKMVEVLDDESEEAV